VKIVDVRSLAIADVRVVRFERFRDERGYFTEPYRQSDVALDPATSFLAGLTFPQANESFSHAGVIRGLHFQWNPFMGKLVRTVSGRMVDLALDIRLDSPTLGKVIAHDMPSSSGDEWSEWIWVPPGFAHGNFFTEETTIEYFCSGEYSPGNEAAVSPDLRDEFHALVEEGAVLSEKDRDAASLSDWRSDPRSVNFRYSELAENAA
jgi:dTDP-4-dehydrorhamnose 3,5-epimerase